MTKVYIGVGHGGKDPGAVSGKYRESDLALEISTACTAELRRHGLEVMQSRAKDDTEPLALKISECNSYKPTVALDIHINAGGGDGFEVFHTINGGKGKELAAAIETEVKAIGQNSRGLRTRKNSSGKDYFGFIRQTTCPAVLVECAFIDTKDVQIIDTAQERVKMGQAIAHGVLHYLGIAVKSPELPSGASASETLITIKVPVIKAGSGSRAQIRRVQKLLNDHGAKLDTDGVWGPLTESAVKAFQKAQGLEPDGKVGPATWSPLISAD